MPDHRALRPKARWIRPLLLLPVTVALAGCPVAEAVSAWLGATGHLFGQLVPQCGCPSQLPPPRPEAPAISGLLRQYDPSSQVVVLTQVHATGPGDPKTEHRDIMLVAGDGSWQAGRYFPSADPPVLLDLASGSLSAARLQALVDLAFEAPATGSRFIDLPSVSYEEGAPRGRRWITLAVSNGSHSVAVDTPQLPAFEALDLAIRHETVAMDGLGLKRLE